MRTVRKLRAAFSTRVARTGSYRAIKATEASALPTTTLTSCVGAPIMDITVVGPIKGIESFILLAHCFLMFCRRWYRLDY